MCAPPIVHSVLTCALPPPPLPRSVVFCAAALAASTVLSTPAAITRVVSLIPLPGGKVGHDDAEPSPVWRSRRGDLSSPHAARGRTLTATSEFASYSAWTKYHHLHQESPMDGRAPPRRWRKGCRKRSTS